MAVPGIQNLDARWRTLHARVDDACMAATRRCDAARVLMQESAGLMARQWRLRLVRCGPGFRVMGMVQPVDEGGRIAVRSVGGSLILELRGQFDLRNAHDLRRVLEVAAERYDRLVLDVTQTTFMDSSGVNALMHGRRAGLEITIRGNSPARRTIELLDLGTVFELED